MPKIVSDDIIIKSMRYHLTCIDIKDFKSPPEYGKNIAKNIFYHIKQYMERKKEELGVVNSFLIGREFIEVFNWLIDYVGNNEEEMKKSFRSRPSRFFALSKIVEDESLKSRDNLMEFTIYNKEEAITVSYKKFNNPYMAMRIGELGLSLFAEVCRDVDQVLDKWDIKCEVIEGYINYAKNREDYYNDVLTDFLKHVGQ